MFLRANTKNPKGELSEFMKQQGSHGSGTEKVRESLAADEKEEGGKYIS